MNGKTVRWIRLLAVSGALVASVLAVVTVLRAGRSSSVRDAVARYVGVAADRVSPERIPAIRDRLARRTADGARSAGLDDELSASLSDAASTVIASVVGRDYATYRALCAPRGLELSEAAAPLLEALGKSSYGDTPEWEAMDVEQKLEYVWTHPAPRQAAAHAIGADGVRVAVGSDPDALPPGANFEGRLSLFQAPDFVRLLKGAQAGTVPCVWVEVPVEYEGLGTRLLRLQFAFDEARRMWHLLRADTVGRGPGPRLVL